MKEKVHFIHKLGSGVLLAVFILLAAFVVWDTNTFAVEQKTGTLNASSVNFRTGPGTSYSSMGKVNKGDKGPILDEGKDTAGAKWYKMRINSKEGWVISTYVDVSISDEDFDAYLEAQGFPESYHDSLKSLHAKYPNWVFEAQQTNLKWSDVIKAEKSLNTVHDSSAPTSWKSTASGDYNWKTNKWIEKDSGGWVTASEAIVKYYMDPRNFLDETYIFQFLKHSYNADKYSEEELAEIKSGLQKMVKGTFLEGKCGSKTYVNVLMSVGKKRGVSPYTLASMIIQEQGVNGTGGSISGKEKGYEGYYNYFNVGAYKTSTLTAVQRGLQYAKTSGSYGRPWDTREKSISGGAQFYAEGYVDRGQDTTYLKKFNVQGNFTHQYMTNVGGAASEGKLMAKAYDAQAREGKLVFKIPVYLNMPSSKCAKPTSDLNPNNRLKSMSVTGYSLTPSFEYDVYEYSLIVENDVKNITVNAKAVATTSTVTGTGTNKLNVGENTIEVTCKAENGNKKVYTITVVRKGQTAPIPELESTEYEVNSDKTITGIDVFPIKADVFAGKFTAGDGAIKIMDQDGKTVTGNVGTGTKVAIYDRAGNKREAYDVLIFGDANGDGKVNARDLLAIQKNIIQVKPLSEICLKSADANHDGKVNARDLLAVQKHIINVKKIEQ